MDFYQHTLPRSPELFCPGSLEQQKQIYRDILFHIKELCKEICWQVA